MDNIRKEINEAYKMLSAIPVSGEGVDLMALAREHLRRAYQLTDETNDEEGECNG